MKSETSERFELPLPNRRMVDSSSLSTEGASKGMRFILPCTKDDSADISLLQCLDQLLALKKTRKLLERATIKPGEGVERIQGNRFEIFVHNNSKTSTAFFDTVLVPSIAKKLSSQGRTVDNIKGAILQYARKKVASIADKEEESSCCFSPTTFTCNNFSILTTYGSCGPQAPHIDLLHPNIQFGLALTDQSPGTICYDGGITEIKSAADLVEAGWSHMSDSLQAILLGPEHSNSEASQLLRNYGAVLDHRLQPQENNRRLARGTLTVLPGSRVHAGPTCHEYRSILFFSGQHKESNCPEYDPNVQYSAPLLCAYVTNCVWLEISIQDRIFLLTRLLEYTKKVGDECNIWNSHDHLLEGCIVQVFLSIVNERGLLSKPIAERNEFIGVFAETNYGHLPRSSNDGGAGDFIAWSQLELVSEPGIVVAVPDLDVQHCPAALYKVQGEHTFLIYFFYEKDPWWEFCTVCESEESSTTAGLSKANLFNGTNAVLKDTDGEALSFECNRKSDN